MASSRVIQQQKKWRGENVFRGGKKDSPPHQLKNLMFLDGAEDLWRHGMCIFFFFFFFQTPSEMIWGGPMFVCVCVLRRATFQRRRWWCRKRTFLFQNPKKELNIHTHTHTHNVFPVEAVVVHRLFGGYYYYLLLLTFCVPKPTAEHNETKR